MKIGPKYKIARRLGSPVFDKTQTQKFSASEARRGKGEKGKKRKQLSEYGLQLIEKQKIRYTYGVAEKQFKNYVKEAIATHGANAGAMLQEYLEVRLDNVVYRFGLAASRQASRQMVSHGHFLVNGKRVTVPSYRLKVGDVIAVREGSKKSALFQNLNTKLDKYMYPAWLTFDPGALVGTLKSRPTREGSMLDFGRVLEFYSR
jgi:small subunit ribosomal protein S4